MQLNQFLRVPLIEWHLLNLVDHLADAKLMAGFTYKEKKEREGREEVDIHRHDHKKELYSHVDGEEFQTLNVNNKVIKEDNSFNEWFQSLQNGLGEMQTVIQPAFSRILYRRAKGAGRLARRIWT